MAVPTPRVQVPAAAKPGEVIQVRSLIGHVMETGLRHDDDGKVIPRKIINRFTCRYNGAEVFAVDLHEAMAANPYIEFYLRATESGAVVWLAGMNPGVLEVVRHAGLDQRLGRERMLFNARAAIERYQSLKAQPADANGRVVGVG